MQMKSSEFAERAMREEPADIWSNESGHRRWETINVSRPELINDSDFQHHHRHHRQCDHLAPLPEPRSEHVVQLGMLDHRAIARGKQARSATRLLTGWFGCPGNFRDERAVGRRGGKD